jgi:predicted TIM-barrel fold metal-dependent hydrolase
MSGPILHRSLAELDAWQSGFVEPVIEPELPIIDAHHHFWLRPPEAYQLPEVLADVGSGHNVRATVFMQNTAMYRADGPEALRPVGETEYVNGAAAVSASGMFGEARICAGIVGYADLRLGEAVAPVLEAHVRAAGARFKGVRQQAQQDPHVGHLSKSAPPQDLLRDPAFHAGMRQLAALGLRFDAFVYFTQLDDVAALADAFPQTPIILNHVGGPLGLGYYAERRAEVWAHWSAGIARLAERPNASVKLGGMGMAAYGFGLAERDRPAASEELAALWSPYIGHCIECFGPDRAMFESNFPLDKQACSYRTLWNAYKRIAAGLSAEEKARLFHGTAKRVYDLATP